MTMTSKKSVMVVPIFGTRHVQVLLLFLGLVVGSMIRLNVSIALVAMTNAKTTNPDFPEYNWNEKQKSYIISSIYWGFTGSQLIGSFVCRKFGAKATMTVSMVLPSILSIITPALMPLGGWQIYCGVRLLQGLFQGMFFPSIFEHIAKWAPVKERTRLGSIAHGGLLIGTILAIMVSGYVAKSSLGWPGISYVAGGSGLIWCVIWLILCDNSPNCSRFISSVEKDYILASQNNISGEHTKVAIPWKSMITSVPCLSLLIVYCAHYWSYSTLVAEIPLYMHGILKMDIKDNALFSGLPYLAMFFMTIIYLAAMEFIMKKNIMSVLALRKTINSIAMWVPSVALLCIGFFDENQKSVAISLLVITVATSGGQIIGSGFNAIDLSPNHVLIIMGVINTVVSGVALWVPIFAGIIVNDTTNRKQWQLVFVIAGVIVFFGNLQYLFFGTNKIQPWNDADFLTNSSDCEKQKKTNMRQVKMKEVSK